LRSNTKRAEHIHKKCSLWQKLHFFLRLFQTLFISSSISGKLNLPLYKASLPPNTIRRLSHFPPCINLSLFLAFLKQKKDNPLPNFPSPNFLSPNFLSLNFLSLNFLIISNIHNSLYLFFIRRHPNYLQNKYILLSPPLFTTILSNSLYLFYLYNRTPPYKINTCYYYLSLLYNSLI